MEPAHRQSGYRSSLLFADCTIVGVNIFNDFREGGFVGAVHCLRKVELWLDEAVGSLARGGLLRGVAVRHHHDHRLRLALRDEVVKDLGGAAELHPRLLVSAHSVQKVKHRVSGLSVVFITCRSVDRHPAPHSKRRAVIPDLRHRPVWHVTDFVKVSLSAADNEYARDRGHIPYLIDIRRVVHTLAVHYEGVAVKLRLKRGTGIFPDTVLILCQFSDARNLELAVRSADFLWRQKVAGHLDSYYIWAGVPESHRVVFIDLRGHHLRPAPKRLLRGSVRSHGGREHNHCRQTKQFMNMLSHNMT